MPIGASALLPEVNGASLTAPLEIPFVSLIAHAWTTAPDPQSAQQQAFALALARIGALELRVDELIRAQMVPATVPVPRGPMRPTILEMIGGAPLAFSMADLAAKFPGRNARGSVNELVRQGRIVEEAGCYRLATPALVKKRAGRPREIAR